MLMQMRLINIMHTFYAKKYLMSLKNTQFTNKSGREEGIVNRFIKQPMETSNRMQYLV